MNKQLMAWTLCLLVSSVGCQQTQRPQRDIHANAETLHMVEEYVARGLSAYRMADRRVEQHLTDLSQEQTVELPSVLEPLIAKGESMTPYLLMPSVWSNEEAGRLIIQCLRVITAHSHEIVERHAYKDTQIQFTTYRIRLTED